MGQKTKRSRNLPPNKGRVKEFNDRTTISKYSQCAQDEVIKFRVIKLFGQGYQEDY